MLGRKAVSEIDTGRHSVKEGGGRKGVAFVSGNQGVPRRWLAKLKVTLSRYTFSPKMPDSCTKSPYL